MVFSISTLCKLPTLISRYVDYIKIWSAVGNTTRSYDYTTKKIPIETWITSWKEFILLTYADKEENSC